MAGAERVGFHSHRGISNRTYEHYNAPVKFVDDKPFEIKFTYPNGASKYRDLEVKERMYWKPGPNGEPAKDAGLFGMDRFDRGSKEAILITEGEYDAIAAYEMLRGKVACISLRASASALKDLQANIDYINSFGKIYLCFDNDEVGKKVSDSIAGSGIFDFNKLYQLKMGKFKDANDYLKNRSLDDFVSAFDNARRYSPSSVISGFNEIRHALNQKQAERVADYPFTDLQTSLKGLHKGEMIVLKTEVCRAIIDKILKERPTKIATIFLEEDQGTTIKGVVTYHLKVPAMSDDSGISDEEVMKAYVDAVKGDDSKLYIHTHFSGDDEKEIIDNIRFLVTVAGCEVIFLDNLTMLNTGREGEDERLRIDRITRMLRNIVNELKFSLVLVAHTNDDGVTTRGSRLPDIVANTVIIMNREQTDTKTYFNVSKARTQGAKAGPAGYAEYDTMEFVLKCPHLMADERVIKINEAAPAENKGWGEGIEL